MNELISSGSGLNDNGFQFIERAELDNYFKNTCNVLLKDIIEKIKTE